jgi:hypothetical protein
MSAQSKPRSYCQKSQVADYEKDELTDVYQNFSGARIYFA